MLPSFSTTVSTPGIPTQVASRPPILEPSPPMSAAMASRHVHNRQALHEVTVTSFGSFILTDSQYGNPVIAVLPRFEDKKSPTSPK